MRGTLECMQTHTQPLTAGTQYVSAGHTTQCAHNVMKKDSTDWTITLRVDAVKGLRTSLMQIQLLHNGMRCVFRIQDPSILTSGRTQLFQGEQLGVRPQGLSALLGIGNICTSFKRPQNWTKVSNRCHQTSISLSSSIRATNCKMAC
jgi:hypothetical protein